MPLGETFRVGWRDRARAASFQGALSVRDVAGGDLDAEHEPASRSQQSATDAGKSQSRTGAHPDTTGDSSAGPGAHWGTTDQPRGDSAAAANNISAAPLDQQLLISPHQLNTGQLHCAAASQS